MAGPQDEVGGLLVDVPALPDVSGLSAEEAASAWWEWEAEFWQCCPDPLDLVPWDLQEEASAAGRCWDLSPPDADAVRRGLAASLTAAGFPQHVVTHLVALAPVLADGKAASCPAVTASPRRRDAGVPGRAPDGDGDQAAGPAPREAEGAAAPASATPAAAVGAGTGRDRAADGELAAAAEALVVVQRWTDALLAGVLADLAAATGEVFLAEKGVLNADELSRTARNDWRAKTKSVLANELKVLTGWGIQDCHDRVGFAVGPRQGTAIPWAALATGEVQWNQVRAWWSACRGMPVEIAAQVAARMFGPDSDRARSARRARGRTGDQGDTARASFGETKDSLARLVAALLGEDSDTAREERHAALARRDATAHLDDHGTGELTVLGRSSSVVAAMDRIDQIARAVRAAGDPRTLAQLRADIAMSLLVHGSITPATGHPDPAPGEAAGADPCGAQGATAPSPGPGSSGAADCTCGSAAAVDGGTEDMHHPGSTDSQPDGSTDPPDQPSSADPDGGIVGPDGGVVGAPDEALAAVLDGRPTANLEVVVPLEVLLNSDSAGVGMLSGGGYLSAEEVRELAMTAGGVLHRLVTDELDGRIVERSRTAYAPDREMRDQVAAADRICRAPGCLVPARKCQFDHVENYIDGTTGGMTSEANGQSLYGIHHQLKTWGAWKAVMDAYRNVTWTTLFGRVYTTRSFDYSTLTHPWTRSTTEPGEGRGSRWLAAVEGDADLQDDLIYAALAHRERDGDRLAAHDDQPDREYLDLGRAWLHHHAPIQLRHLTRTGKRRTGAPPGQPTPEELLQDQTDPREPSDADVEPAAEAPPF